MKFLGTFKQIFEAHEVKPRLRDIAMFVTLNNTRLYPREQFDENGDIHPYLAPRLDLIKIIKQENSVKWFFTESNLSNLGLQSTCYAPSFPQGTHEAIHESRKVV